MRSDENLKPVFSLVEITIHFHAMQRGAFITIDKYEGFFSLNTLHYLSSYHPSTY